MATPVRSDHTALIAEARREAKGWRSVNTGNAALSWGKAQLLDRLAAALEQVTAERDAAYTAIREALGVSLPVEGGDEA